MVKIKAESNEFIEKYPTHGSKLLEIWYSKILDLNHAGRWRDDKFGKGPRPNNSNRSLAKGWIKTLTKAQLMRAFSSREKSDIRFYEGSPSLSYKGCPLSVLMFDIDYKLEDQTKADSQKVFEALKNLLPMVPFYGCPSTGGLGMHAYATIQFDPSYSPEMIHGAVCELRDLIKERINTGSFLAVFDRINGLPFYHKAGAIKRGTLAKIPFVPDDAAAGQLIESISSPVDYDLIVKHLKENSESINAPIITTIAYPPPVLSAPGKFKQKDLERYAIEVVMGAECSQITLNDLALEQDALKRRRGFAFRYCRQVNRAADSAELLQAYEQSGLATGARTTNRANDFDRIAQYIQENFKPITQTLSMDRLFAGAKEKLNALITPQVLSQRYGKRHNRSRLLIEDVALVYAMYLYGRDKAFGDSAAITAKAAVGLSRKMKENKQVNRTLDFKRFAASKGVLVDLGLIFKVGNHQRGVTGERYLVKA